MNSAPAFIFAFLAACSSLPNEFEQAPGQTWPHPEQTKLGALIAETAPEDKTLSGVELLADPSEAFSTRFAIAAFAEKTLAIQYYLWKADLSGQLLLWRVLEAADRGVKVRFLIDDIYHAGRDEFYAILATHPNFQLRVFNPMANRGAARNLNFLVNKSSLNRRMHNKIFMADGAVAVLGGRNIGDDYFGIDPDANFLDLDVLTVGQGAIEAGAAFDEYWNSKKAVPIDVLNQKEYTAKDLESLREKLTGPVRPSLYALMGIAGLVVLLGCLNLAGLVLFRTTQRMSALSIRRALGASRSRLFTQLMAEVLILAGLAGVIGLGTASTSSKHVDDSPQNSGR